MWKKPTANFFIFTEKTLRVYTLRRAGYSVADIMRKLKKGNANIRYHFEKIDNHKEMVAALQELFRC